MYLRLLFLSTLSFYIFLADMLYVTRARISSTAAMGDLGVNLSFQENYADGVGSRSGGSRIHAKP
ncbi:hypothetical protein Hanom_Chr02g00139191 [Helianthus anomalus]